MAKVKVPVLNAGGSFKDYADLYKVQSLSTNCKHGCQHYRLSKFVQKFGNSEGKVYPARSLYGINCGIRRYLEETEESEAFNSLDASDER